jgi:hypothetical protein
MRDEQVSLRALRGFFSSPGSSGCGGVVTVLPSCRGVTGGRLLDDDVVTHARHISISSLKWQKKTNLLTKGERSAFARRRL